MKTFKFLFLSMALVSLSLSSQSCKEEEPIATCDDGIQNGDEEGVDCGGACAACPEGVQETRWQSSGANVAPLLVTLFNTDSIYAEFNYDFTYTVEQYDNTGAKQTLTGTYAQAESAVAGIWTITINQTTPATITAEGIFQIQDNTMKYEIAQTVPDIGAVPPTPEGGFGSTSGGALGTANVQTFVRIE